LLDNFDFRLIYKIMTSIIKMNQINADDIQRKRGV
jgi:hypothetical protein